jgi:hypothetical protein
MRPRRTQRAAISASPEKQSGSTTISHTAAPQIQDDPSGGVGTNAANPAVIEGAGGSGAAARKPPPGYSAGAATAEVFAWAW